MEFSSSLLERSILTLIHHRRFFLFFFLCAVSLEVSRQSHGKTSRFHFRRLELAAHWPSRDGKLNQCLQKRYTNWFRFWQSRSLNTRPCGKKVNILFCCCFNHVALKLVLLIMNKIETFVFFITVYNRIVGSISLYPLWQQRSQLWVMSPKWKTLRKDPVSHSAGWWVGQVCLWLYWCTTWQQLVHTFCYKKIEHCDWYLFSYFLTT